MLNDIINTCYVLTHTSQGNVRIIASYSHIVPVILSLILGIFVFIKAEFNFFSKVFLAFISIFALWLVGDLVTWTSNNYNLVYATWSFLLYLEIAFFTLGLYFAVVFAKKSDISLNYKLLLFLGTLVPFILTITKQSVLGFNQPICEAFNNNSLDIYKLFYEGIILAIMLIYTITPFFKRLPWQKIKPDLVVIGSMFLFLATFGVTEYLASVTGYYELNLYSLFLLPVFLVAIIYSVFELDIFNVHILGTHYLVVGLVILTGGQLFFISNSTYRLLTLTSMFLTIVLSIILFRNLKRESDQRTQISKLNIELGELIKQRENLVHLVTHKVKGSFTRSKYIFAGMLDGSFGETTPEIKKRAEQGLESDNMGIETVDLVLNVANMEKGIIKYDMKKIELREILEKTISEKKDRAQAKGLKIESTILGDSFFVRGDSFWVKEAISNLIENSIKYTRAGKITVELKKRNDKANITVKDTGVGITEDDKKNLFTEGGRGKDSVKINVDSTGYGLYSVKLIMNAHQGKVWAESKGEGQGSSFFLELPLV